MNITPAAALRLCEGAARGLGFEPDDARIVAEHLVDSALRGAPGGLAPLVMLKGRFEASARARRPIEVVAETPVSAVLDGGDNVGLVVAHRAARLGIEKARRAGVAMVGARNTYFTGNLAFYMEMATREDLVAMAFGNGMASVAPHGAAEARIGTNPVAFGFPTTDDPIIWDVSTAAITHAEVRSAQQGGRLLPEGAALDAAGAPTTDPTAALAGALRAWGGHRGSGLGIVAHLMGMVAGTAVNPPVFREFGFFYLVFDPALMTPVEAFKRKASDLAESVAGARPQAGSPPPRAPFRGSAERRRQAMESGLEVADPIHRALEEMAAG